MARLSNTEQQALMEELVTSVKAFTPEWTAQSSDPGIAIIELLAWLGMCCRHSSKLVAKQRQKIGFFQGSHFAVDLIQLASIS